MEFDVMTRATTWDNVADLARKVQAAGFSGMLFTEGHQVPWMNIAAASLAAPRSISRPASRLPSRAAR